VKRKFDIFYRGGLFALLAILGWTLWAEAQPATNDARPATNVTAATTSAPGRLARDLEALRRDLEERDPVFRLDRVSALREHTLLGQPLWKYLSSLIYILLAFYVSKILDFIVNAWLKHWATRTETRLDDLLLEVLHGPVKVVAFVIFLHIGLTVFRWPAMTEAWLAKGFVLVVAFSLTYAALKLVDLLMGLWRERTAAGTDRSFDEQLFPVVRKSIKIFLVVVAVLVTWQNLSEKPITAILASLSIGGLALGLAAQDTLANLFGAVAVYIDKPFRIGDRIQLDAVDGTVESIGLRSTRLRNLDGHHVTIPNKTVGNATITNITRRTRIKTEMNLGLTYDTPPEKIRRALEILEEVYRAHPMTADLMVSFNKFADSALNLLIVHWWNSTDPRTYLAGMQELNLKIKERFDAEGIAFAFPTRTLLVKQDSEWRVTPK
jgi:MscS family membrane protein